MKPLSSIGICILIAVAALIAGFRSNSPAAATLIIRGHPQKLRLYGSRGAGEPIVVSSGDGGWIHLAPEVAETLSGHGFFVVGFDTLAYLQSFTSGSATLAHEDEPGDYRTLVDFASRGSSTKPILIGVSEGAGLSVLASTDPTTQQAIAGVIALGLPRLTELGWRWKDSMTYLTHRVPDEPTFSTTDVIGKVRDTPLAVIQSTGDEFTSIEEVRTILGSATDPTRLSIVPASNHRFSGNLPQLRERMLEAIAWIQYLEPR